MAASNAEYAANAVYGSAAYDLSGVAGGYALPQEERYYRPSTRELEEERLRQRQRARAHELARARELARPRTFGIPVFGVLGTLVVAVVMVFMLLNYVQLAEISKQTYAVRSSIAELSEQNEILRVRYEMTFDMAQVETYAVNILGMSKMDAQDAVVYSAVRTDKAEILQTEEQGGFLDRVVHFFEPLLEYFK